MVDKDRIITHDSHLSKYNLTWHFFECSSYLLCAVQQNFSLACFNEYPPASWPFTYLCVSRNLDPVQCNIFQTFKICWSFIRFDVFLLPIFNICPCHLIIDIVSNDYTISKLFINGLPKDSKGIWSNVFRGYILGRFAWYYKLSVKKKKKNIIFYYC